MFTMIIRNCRTGKVEEYPFLKLVNATIALASVVHDWRGFGYGVELKNWWNAYAYDPLGRAFHSVVVNEN
jgi:hypothetical protein